MIAAGMDAPLETGQLVKLFWLEAPYMKSCSGAGVTACWAGRAGAETRKRLYWEPINNGAVEYCSVYQKNLFT